MSLAPAAIDAAVEHARAAAPDECCGLLLGRGDDIVAAVATRNVAATPTVRFQVDPRDHIEGRRVARARGLDVVGFYHSHPHSTARPSSTDLAEAAYPGCFYLIVGLAADPPERALFRFENGAFIPVGL